MNLANLAETTKLIELDISQDGFSLLRNIETSTSQHLLEIAQAIGSIETGIDMQLIGSLVMDLYYDPIKIKTNQRPAYYTSDAFPVHTDLSYVDLPPRFILMHCIQPASDGEGITLLANCALAFKKLPEHFQNILTQPIFYFSYPPNCPMGTSQALAVCNYRNNKEIWRFRMDSMSCEKDTFQAVQFFQKALEEVASKLTLRKGDLLIIDNHRIAHGRTAFLAKAIELGGRHIRRVYSQEKNLELQEQA